MSAIPQLDEAEKYLAAILDDPSGIELAEFAWVDEEQPDRCFRVWDYQWCLTGDVVIYTDQGRRRLDQSVGSVRLLTEADGERGQWVDAEVRAYGQALVYDVVLERRGVQRVIGATAEHRWFAGTGRADRRVYGERLTCDLQPGDLLRPVTSPEQPWGVDRSWVQRGVLAGDGTVVRGVEGLVRLYGDKRALAAFFDGPGRSYDNGNTSVPALEYRGLPGSYKTDLPDLGKPEECWGWLAGYFATDGAVAPDGTCVLSTTSQRLAFAVRDVATALGVVCSAVGHRTRDITAPDGVTRPTTELLVTLRRSDLPSGFFLRPSHALKMAVVNVGGRALDAWRVVEVRERGVEDVYCAEVPGTHSFVLDGDILTGNSWYHCEDTFQIDQAGRSLGKSVGIQMRAFAFPFNFPGQEMLITAPELNHLRPITDKVENLFLTVRLGQEMLPRTKGNGINHQPQFQARFVNNARIFSRLPNRDGKGVKGSCASATSSNAVSVWDAGTMLTTLRGQVPMEDVNTDDYVLTHRGRYMPVRHVHSYEAEAVEVAGAGHRGMVTSTNHRFWARRNANPQRTRNLSAPTWMPVDDPELARYYWATPTQFPELELPDLPGDITDALSLLSLAGSYVADGNLIRAYEVTKGFALTDAEAAMPALTAVLAQIGLRYTMYSSGGGAPQARVHNTEVARWLNEHFGHLANGKKVPSWLLGAPEAARKSFLDAYLAGDGHWSQAKQRWEFGTASKALAIGVKLLAQSLGYQTSYSWVDPKVTHIGGRALVNEPQRSHRVQITNHGHGVMEDGMLWGKLRSATPVGTRTVYDLVVAEDHSYVADGIVSLGSAFLPDGQEA